MTDECEEPKCSAPANKDWNGRKVCDDHFDMYRDEQDKIYMDMD
ncbi:MAG: hypothetical protein ABIC04_01290 [Nanoarchaeota archaeon]